MFSLFKKKPKENTASVHVKQEPHFDDGVAKEILAKIKEEFGLDYAKQEFITMRKIERFARKKELYNFEELSKLIQTSQTMKQELVNMLTVGETYFYRETGHFEILASLCQEKQINNILCAPSSSGEEAYSIAIYLDQKATCKTLPNIVGIDVNSDSIKNAQTALYSERSVSPMPTNIRENYFDKHDTKYAIKEQYKRKVKFQVQNIFDDSLYGLGKFDAVFCRNMLIYFNDTEKKEVLKRIHKLLNTNGILFLGHADISFEPEGFEKKVMLSSSYFVKV